MLHKIHYMKREVDGLGTLSYILLHERITTAEGKLSAYGVEIALHSARGEKTASACNITTSRRKMEHILAVLCRNTVTPCVLHEVLEELL